MKLFFYELHKKDVKLVQNLLPECISRLSSDNPLIVLFIKRELRKVLFKFLPKKLCNM